MWAQVRQLQCWHIEVLVVLMCWFFAMHVVINSATINTTAGSCEIREDVWPFYVALCHFMVQFVICGAVVLSFSPSTICSSLGQKQVQTVPMVAELNFLMRCREAAGMMALVGFVCGGYYTCNAFMKNHYIGSLGWFQNVDEPRFLTRYLLWSFCGPMQWVILSRLCTLATHIEIVRIVIATMMVMLLGLFATAEKAMIIGDVLAPFQWHRLCFILSSIYCIVVFKRVFALRPEPSLASAWHMAVGFQLFIYIAMPSVHVFRTCGLISANFEYIAYSFLDMTSKTLIGVSITSRSVVVQLASIMFSAKDLVDVSPNLILTVEDPGWRLVVPKSDMDMAAMEHLIGRPVESINFLEDMVQDENQRKALLQAAEQADSKGNFTAQKVCATLFPPSSHHSKVECLISRSLYGLRQVSIVSVEPVQDKVDSVNADLDPQQHPEYAALTAARAVLKAAEMEMQGVQEDVTSTSRPNIDTERLSELIRQTEEMLASRKP